MSEVLCFPEQGYRFPEVSSVPEFAAVSKQTGSLQSLDMVVLSVILQRQESQKQNMLLLQLPRK